MASPACETPIHAPKAGLPFHSFDLEYLQRLASGDAVVESHFSSYFGNLLLLKLRIRIRRPQLIEDIRQETLLRVLQIVRRKGVQSPERFGAFVSAVCNNVMMEVVRGESRHKSSESEFEPVDNRVDLEAPLVNQQRRRIVDSVLEELPAKDRELLRMFFLEECDKGEICKRFEIREGHLRVLLHRAKLRFRSMHSKRFSGPVERRDATVAVESSYA
jgi:RNA polymerase sigma-70 factor (ECF subfamily)